MTAVAIAHDYLTLRGGAERVVLEMARTFPDAPIYCSLYEPGATFPEFRYRDVRPSPLNTVAALRHNHRLAMPVLPWAFGRMHIEADVVLCSSSGWAHGASTSGRRVVYCHTPPPWLYRPDMFVGTTSSVTTRLALAIASRPLRRWDQGRAHTAAAYIANSRTVAAHVREIYGREAAVLHPPPALTPEGEERQPAGVEPGYFLVVSRLYEYKNVAAVIDAVAQVPDARLVIVGRGPDESRLRALAGPATTFRTDASDAELRWLYRNCAALVAAAEEDFGLTPVEANGFGRPSLCWRRGGYLDSMAEGRSGLFFDEPSREAIAAAMRRSMTVPWDEPAIRTWAQQFAAERFAGGLRELVARAK